MTNQNFKKTDIKIGDVFYEPKVWWNPERDRIIEDIETIVIRSIVTEKKKERESVFFDTKRFSLTDNARLFPHFPVRYLAIDIERKVKNSDWSLTKTDAEKKFIKLKMQAFKNEAKRALCAKKRKEEDEKFYLKRLIALKKKHPVAFKELQETDKAGAQAKAQTTKKTLTKTNDSNPVPVSLPVTGRRRR